MTPRSLLWPGLGLTLLACLWLATLPDELDRRPDTGLNIVPPNAARDPARSVGPANSTPLRDRGSSTERGYAQTPTDTTWRSLPWPEPSAQALQAWGTGAAAKPAAVAATASASASASAVEATATERSPPTPPPFPYQWIGRLDDGRVPLALLANHDSSIGARVGDVLDGHWRIDCISAASLQLTWLPTARAMTVAAR